MHDNLTPRGGDDQAMGRASSKTGEPATPLTDREVPLPAAAEFVALHAWLDGEVEEMPVSTAAAARQRDVWRRINEDAARMRRMSPPPFIEQKVMQAIATDVAAGRQAQLSPVTEAPRAPGVTVPVPIAVVAAVACAALGALVALLAF
jgi:hypothetical protein